jgi:hypothetical protein
MIWTAVYPLLSDEKLTIKICLTRCGRMSAFLIIFYKAVALFRRIFTAHMKMQKFFLYAAMLLTICEVTGITFFARQDKAFCYAAGGFESPAEEDETREEIEDPDDFFCETYFSLPGSTSIDPTFSSSADIRLTQHHTEIVVPPPQG